MAETNCIEDFSGPTTEEEYHIVSGSAVELYSFSIASVYLIAEHLSE